MSGFRSRLNFISRLARDLALSRELAGASDLAIGELWIVGALETIREPEATRKQVGPARKRGITHFSSAGYVLLTCGEHSAAAVSDICSAQLRLAALREVANPSSRYQEIELVTPKSANVDYLNDHALALERARPSRRPILALARELERITRPTGCAVISRKPVGRVARRVEPRREVEALVRVAATFATALRPG